MTIKYLELAKLEFNDSIAYYEKQQKDLGRRFSSEINSSIQRIKEFPMSYVQIKQDIRRCTLHKFPYNILYSIENDNILIVAIAHHHREPDYWVKRIDELGDMI